MELLGTIPAALGPVAIVLYFSDQNTKSWMNERRDIALAVLNERKEFLATQQHLLERYDARLTAAVEAASNMKSEMHNLRGTITQFILRLEDTRRSRE